MLFISVAEYSGTEMAVIVEVLNVAVSDGPLGIVAGSQLPTVYQSPLDGLGVQVALPAWLGWMLSSKTSPSRSPAMHLALRKRGSASRLDVVGCFFIGFFSGDFFVEAGLLLARLDFRIGFEMMSVAVSLDWLEVVLLEISRFAFHCDKKSGVRCAGVIAGARR